MKQLGFNAVRLPYRFSDFLYLNPLIVEHQCQVAPALNVQYTLVPDAGSYPYLPLTGLPYPSEAPPNITNSICSAQFLDNMSVRDRYIMNVKFLIGQGFYVSMDYHNIAPDAIVSNYTEFIGQWVSLLTDVLAAVPEAKGRLLLDMINEPDGYGFKWEGSSTAMSLHYYYTGLMDAMWPICPDCLFIGEGTGATNLAANWGDGFVTNQAVVAQSGVSDATAFFNDLVTKPYVQQFIVGPHIYCADVSGSSYATSGQALYSKLSTTFGYLNLKGFCPSNGQPCHRFVTIIDEFGSLFDNQEELTCFRSIVAYANNEAEAADGIHGVTDSWFYWSWQPDSYGTGGILADDYRTIQWFKINALSGGTSYMPTGLGLRPWYLKGFNPVQPIASVAPAPIAAAPEGALPPAAEAPAGPVQACANGTVTYLGNCSTSSVIPGQLYYAGTVSEAAAASKGSQLAIETAVPIGSVLLVAALSALAAYTGCFGAKAAAMKAANTESSGPAAGKYAAKVGKAAQVPVSVTAGPSARV
ncbi:hypothetical protein CVIRNUC_009811 [Coccomyxa viridis]|uniref:Glycoside hydrolase family 5 domain-containing protein n=1 Tax=Coccomyxa viridis TaxID=1274662 RepID=A0AAV1IK69_9CHLO|nr:hypothetical protein CVIRNUC_009811 [Coccomyxa viridis]